MDSAEDQKTEIEKIKGAVSQSVKARRAFRVSKKAHRATQAPAEVQASQAARTQTPTQVPDHVYSDLLEQPQLSSSAPRSETMKGITSTLPLAEPWPRNNIDTSTLPPTTIPLSTLTLDIEPKLPLFLSAVGLTTDTIAEAHLRVLHPQTKEATSYPFSFLPNAPPAENEHDLAMIMNYLDVIFPLQFYFYQPSTAERGRGWLLSLLLRDKSSYYTALSFSVLQQVMFVYNGDAAMEQRLLEELDQYHSLAIAELQRQLDYLPSLSGAEHLKTGLGTLACTIQLLSIEVFRETKAFKGWKGDWEVHLRAASTILSLIGTQLRISFDGSDSSGSTPGSAESETSLVPLSEIAGLDFFITAYVWGDIVCCASIGLDPSLPDPFPYVTYLEEDRIKLDRLMGCRNWVMISIREISELEAWKTDMKKHRSLSIPMLSHKAAGVESVLNAGLSDLPKLPNDLKKYEQECNLVTEVYALSALIYLAVVVSGNSHFLPEVRLGVRRALSALQVLPQHLLIRVSWPYCVAGCMAHDSEKEAFREILSTTAKNGHLLGTLDNGLEIAEHFWLIRDALDKSQLDDGCAWKIAMDDLRLKILLI